MLAVNIIFAGKLLLTMTASKCWPVIALHFYVIASQAIDDVVSMIIRLVSYFCPPQGLPGLVTFTKYGAVLCIVFRKLNGCPR